MTDETPRPPFDVSRLERLRDHVETLEANRAGQHEQNEQLIRQIEKASMAVSTQETSNGYDAPDDDPTLANLRARVAALKEKRAQRLKEQKASVRGLSTARDLLDKCDSYARKHGYRKDLRGWPRSTIDQGDLRNRMAPLPGHEDDIQRRKDKARGVML
jgi:hypothetical protein